MVVYMMIRPGRVSSSCRFLNSRYSGTITPTAGMNLVLSIQVRTPRERLVG